jgi:hypothetical protein
MFLVLKTLGAGLNDSAGHSYKNDGAVLLEFA